MSNEYKYWVEKLVDKPINCPICRSKKFYYKSYSESIGTVEQYGICKRCGYSIDQCYSPVWEGFLDTPKGYKDYNGFYHKKDIRKHKRIRRKLNNIAGIEVIKAMNKYNCSIPF